MVSDEQFAAYLAGSLDPATRESVEQELLADPEARTELLDQRRISAGLHALLGDPSALENAVFTTLRSSPEEAAIQRIVSAAVDEARPIPATETPWQRSFTWVRQMAAVLVAAACTAALLQIPQRREPVAVLRDIIGAEWKAGDTRTVGTTFKPGWQELKEGVAELEFRSGARVAVQGPARFRLIDQNAMEITDGKLAADVPQQAIGFTVHTPAGQVVDLGTRFGVTARGNKHAEVHVLEGLVSVQPITGEERALQAGQAVTFTSNKQNGILEMPYAPEQFPQPSRTLGGLLVGGGFEEDTLVAIDYAPRQFNLWSGDPSYVVPQSDGISPRSGRQMLRFEIPGSGKPAASEQWQLVDLRPARAAAHGTSTDATLSVWFNRASWATSGASFGVTLAAFRGDPAHAPHFWAARHEKALALAEHSIRTDLNPTTWERAETRLTIPRDADFLLVQIAANQELEPANGNFGPSAHYADDAKLEIHIGARSAGVKAGR